MNRRNFLKFLRNGAGAAVVAATVGLPEVEVEEPEIEAPEVEGEALEGCWQALEDDINYVTSHTDDDTIYVGGTLSEIPDRLTIDHLVEWKGTAWEELDETLTNIKE